MEAIGCQLDATAIVKEPRYNKSMPETLTIESLKEHIAFWEKRGQINDDTEVIIGKQGTSSLIDGPQVQKKVTDTDIQVVRSKVKLPDKIAFTLVHK